MQKHTLITFLAMSFAATTCMAQGLGTAAQSAPDRREIINTSNPSSSTTTRNEPVYQATQRQEMAVSNTTIDRNSVNTRNYTEANNYNSSRQDYNNSMPYDKANLSGYSGLNNHANPQPIPGSGTVRTRFSPVNHRYYYYSSSDYTRNKCRDTCYSRHLGAGGNVVEHFWAGPDGRIYSYWPCAVGSFMYYQFYLMHGISRDMLLLPDNTTKHSNSSQFYSFDGYIVYNADTIAGIVTITQNSVSLEKPINHPERNYYSSQLDDRQLKAIVVYKGPKELHLVRLSPTDKHLSRMVHGGKLMLFDKSYNFLTTDNISNNLQLINTTTGEQTKVKTKQELATAVNKAYGMNIQAEGTSRKELIGIINRLD